MNVNASPLYLGILASDSLTGSFSFIAPSLRERNDPLSNPSASKSVKMNLNTRTDEAHLASPQSTGSICTPEMTTVRPPDQEKVSMGRKDKSTGLSDKRTPNPSRPKEVVTKLVKRCHHVLCGLPSHVVPGGTRVSGVCRRGKGRHNACETWIVHLIMINQHAR